MKIHLTEDDGTVINSWYVPDEETLATEISSAISRDLPVYDDREEYEESLKEE